VKQPLGEELVVDNVGENKQLLHQWTSVFRYTSGIEVSLFSTSNLGYDYLYQIKTISKQKATLLFLSKSKNIIPLRKCLLYMALVKKDTFETITRQAVELGVTHIIPVLTSRCEKKGLNFERLNVIAIEAAEQSGRGDIPEISEIEAFDTILQTCIDKNITYVVATLQGESQQSIKDKLKNEDCALWIGPEGGWTEDEEKLFEGIAFLKLKLTETVLKADTAAISTLSLMLI
jgi:16S rRNA (uracil1498-N3)-methyltransferase